MAIKHHLAKSLDNPQAEERFKRIARAYQTLSDPVLRSEYNEFGHRNDPEEVFSAILGGNKFLTIIGQTRVV